MSACNIIENFVTIVSLIQCLASANLSSELYLALLKNICPACIKTSLNERCCRFFFFHFIVNTFKFISVRLYNLPCRSFHILVCKLSFSRNVLSYVSNGALFSTAQLY